ncbi:hypothetical protein R3P38DRAFT_3206855 [Favolaschia claudopus]|uniref:Uncharacterized protein n=1 Tax=Favolaschia claudopus TaxID=2862362 RepID=A0AAW0AL47_9AGAR
MVVEEEEKLGSGHIRSAPLCCLTKRHTVFPRSDSFSSRVYPAQGIHRDDDAALVHRPDTVVYEKVSPDTGSTTANSLSPLSFGTTATAPVDISAMFRPITIAAPSTLPGLMNPPLTLLDDRGFDMAQNFLGLSGPNQMDSPTAEFDTPHRDDVLAYMTMCALSPPNARDQSHRYRNFSQTAMRLFSVKGLYAHFNVSLGDVAVGFAEHGILPDAQDVKIIEAFARVRKNMQDGLDLDNEVWADERAEPRRSLHKPLTG